MAPNCFSISRVLKEPAGREGLLQERVQKRADTKGWRSRSVLTAALLALLVLGAASAAPPSSRTLQSLVVLSLLAALGLTGWKAASAWMPDAGRLSRAVFALTVAVATVTVPATVLGHFGYLRLEPFLLVVALACGVSLLLNRRDEPSLRTASAEPRPAGFLETSLLFAAIALVTLRLGASFHHAIRDPAAYMGYDDLSYHLPAMAVWHRYGDLRTIKFETGDPSTTFYPFVSELCSWALLAPLRDCDVLARRVQLLFAFGSLLAVAALGRRCGLNRSSALTAALVYATVDGAFPVLALGAGNDHAACFLTLAGLDGAFELASRRSRRAALYPGIALGLLVGTKYLGLLFGVVVFAVLGAFLVLGRSANIAEDSEHPGGAPWRRLREGFDLLAVLVLMILVCGGYAYARNAWTASNPVYPQPLRIFGRELASGLPAATLAWRRHRPESQIQVASYLLRQSALMGGLFVWSMLPASVIAPVTALARRRWREALLFTLPIVFFLLFLFLIGDHRGIRYVLPGLAIAAVAAVWSTCLLGERWAPFLRCALLAGVLFAVASHLPLKAGALGLALVALLALGAALSAGRRRIETVWLWAGGLSGDRFLALAWLLGIAATVALVCLSPSAIDRFQDAKVSGVSVVTALESLTGDAGAGVAYVGLNRPYDYFGSRLQNDVHLVPSDGDLPSEYYSWGGDVRFPFRDGSPDRWRDSLAQLHIRWVVAVRNPGEGPERGWMQALPTEFSLVERSGDVEIWQVGRDRSGAAIGLRSSNSPPGGAVRRRDPVPES
jgi:hypothetical protein